MEFPYRPELVEEAGRHFDAVVAKITAKDFRVISSAGARHLQGVRSQGLLPDGRDDSMTTYPMCLQTKLKRYRNTLSKGDKAYE